MTTNQVAPISAVSGELLTKTYERRLASSGNLSFKPRGCTSFYNATVTAGASMGSLHKAIGVVCGGFLLSLGLSTVAQTEMFDRRPDYQQPGEKQLHEMESGQSTGGKTIKGEVLRVEGNDCFIKGQDGKEVRLHIDLTTLKARNIEPGERIEAKVNDQNQVLAILSEPATTDRRNDK
jgi:hypothetical protein